MKKIIFSLFLFFTAASLGAYPTHSQQLAHPVQLLYQLDEIRQLVAQIEQEGPLSIKSARFGYGASNAMWVASERTIVLNFSNRRTLGNILASIVFEMHNAVSDQQFIHLDTLAEQGQLSKDQYIQAVERLEYDNAIKTARVLGKGVRQGLFPADAEWWIPPSFEQHYQMQISAGHSAQIGYIYDDIIRTSRRLLATDGGFQTQAR